ncbi:hypothetical protein PG997_012904 [Apiospora hydei]|uniref:BTB domain-containing protein n=1 Tax=Apiospora hydei TaxID=1337664 RepID=A0ABR1V5H5_9PEZI
MPKYFIFSGPSHPLLLLYLSFLPVTRHIIFSESKSMSWTLHIDEYAFPVNAVSSEGSMSPGTMSLGPENVIFTPQDTAEGSRTPELMTLDPEGDVIIMPKETAECYKPPFLVSSRVLSLASPVFAKMFGPESKDERELRSRGQLRLRLDDDDPEAVELLLCVLHFHSSAIPRRLEITKLLPLARLCDKYDCCEALMPWASQWCAIQGDTPQLAAAWKVLSAYLFRTPTFEAMTSQAARYLSMESVFIWPMMGSMGLLPDRITCLLETSSGIAVS